MFMFTEKDLENAGLYRNDIHFYLKARLITEENFHYFKDELENRIRKWNQTSEGMLRKKIWFDMLFSDTLSNGNNLLYEYLYSLGEVSIDGFLTNPLESSCRGSRMSSVQWLLKKGANIHITETCIFDAVEFGSLSLIKLLVDSGIGLNVSDKTGRTPLSIAAFNGSVNSLKYMLLKGASVSYMNNKAIKSALLAGNREAVDILLRYGGKIEKNDIDYLEESKPFMSIDNYANMKKEIEKGIEKEENKEICMMVN